MLACSASSRFPPLGRSDKCALTLHCLHKHARARAAGFASEAGNLDEYLAKHDVMRGDISRLDLGGQVHSLADRADDVQESSEGSEDRLADYAPQVAPVPQLPAACRGGVASAGMARGPSPLAQPREPLLSPWR